MCIPGLKNFELPKNTFEQDYDRALFIRKMVCSFFNKTVEDVCKKNRTISVVAARDMSCVLIYLYTDISLLNISKIHAPAIKDHTAVLNALGKIKGQLSLNVDNDTKKNYETIKPYFREWQQKRHFKEYYRNRSWGKYRAGSMEQGNKTVSSI